VIAGAKSADQVSDNVVSSELELATEQIAAISALTAARQPVT